MRLVILLAVCLAAGGQIWALERSHFESRLDEALENRLAVSEEEILRQRARAIEAESGARLFGAVGASQVRDVVTRDLVRSYPALSAQVGLRWPLYGSLAGETRARAGAEAAIAQSAWNRAAVRGETLRDLRIAYVEALRRDQQVELADAFLLGEAEATRVLAQRRDRRLLLEADYREFVSMFALVRRDRAVFAEERGRARRRLSAITGLRVDDELSPPAFRTGCLALDELLTRRSEQAPLQSAQARREERRRLLQASGTTLPEAGLVLSQGIVQDLGGQTGATTYLGMDFRLPLDWRGAADARRAEAMAELERAELAVRQSESRFEDAANRAVAGLQASRIGLSFAAERLAASQSLIDTARLRLRLADGDVIERYFQARLALYRAASDQIEAHLAYERAQAEALLLAPECPAEQADDTPAPNPQAAIHALAQPLGNALPVSTEAAGRFGWYAWQGGRWLRRADDPAWMARLARRADRVMLGFDAAEIAELAGKGRLAGRLEHFLASARERGIAVDLLLGDPDWLSPAGRTGLLEYVRKLSGYRFDGLHLDLERSQLPAPEQPNYPAWLVDTVAEVARNTPLPLALSIHYRDAESQEVVEKLRQAGLRELCLMVYVANIERVKQIVEPILRRHPDLRIAVAQSVERRLPATESHAGRGAAGSLLLLRKLAQDLRHYPNFAGIRVQSLEDFAVLAP